jgi:fido (protein-threonine AMPylation protein)
MKMNSMENKLGLTENEIIKVEDQIFELKSKLVDYRFTFDTDGFGINYLIRLHDFLFGDLYYNAGKISERYLDADKEIIDENIKRIVDLIKSHDDDISYIVELIQDLINNQIFDDGNSRTINLFFNIVIDCYLQ